jgi:phage tail-like protein
VTAINTRDTRLSHQFAVEITGIVHASFDECSGLEAKMEVEEYKEGGVNGYTHKLPGRVSFTNVTLKWGTQHSSALWDWYVDVVSKTDKTSELRSVSILQLDQTRQEVRRWNLQNAFPVKWVGPSYNAANSQIGVETLELAFNDLTFVSR